METRNGFIIRLVLKLGIVQTVRGANFFLLIFSIILFGISAIVIEKSTEQKIAPYVSPQVIYQMEDLQTKR